MFMNIFIWLHKTIMTDNWWIKNWTHSCKGTSM